MDRGVDSYMNLKCSGREESKSMLLSKASKNHREREKGYNANYINEYHNKSMMESIYDKNPNKSLFRNEKLKHSLRNSNSEI